MKLPGIIDVMDILASLLYQIWSWQQTGLEKHTACDRFTKPDSQAEGHSIGLVDLDLVFIGVIGFPYFSLVFCETVDHTDLSTLFVSYLTGIDRREVGR